MLIVIVGAGVIGAACADALAAAGHHVHVLDMRGPGRGATQASAGVLAPFIEARDGALLDMCAESLALYDDFVTDLEARSGRRIEYARSGTLEVAISPEDATRLKALGASLSARRIESEWLEGAALASREPTITSAALGGLSIGTHGFVSAPDLVDALVRAAGKAGVTFDAPADVQRVEPSTAQGRDIVDVVLSDGRRLQADAVVLAAGSWASRLRVGNDPAPAVKPIRGQLLHLKWPDKDPFPSGVVWAPRCYTVPWSDRTLLVGATSEDVGFDERSTVAGTHGLLGAVGDLMPAAWRASVADIRVGLRPAAPTELPIIEASPQSPRIVTATGHFRNGVLLTPFTAKKVVQLMEQIDGQHT